MMSSVNPVPQLFEHLQRYYKARPNVTYAEVVRDTDGPPHRAVICTVELPGLAEGSAPTTFQEEGRGKKDAKKSACAAAWEWLQLQPLPSRSETDDDCWGTIARMVALEGLRKDRELNAGLRWAVQYNQRVVPLPLLLHSKQLQQWANRTNLAPGPTQPLVPALLAAMQQRLQEDPAAVQEQLAAAGTGVTLSPDGTSLVLPEAYSDVLPLDDEISSPSPALVLVPADIGHPVQQLQLEAGGDVLSALAGLLGVPVGELVFWGRVGAGRRAPYVATPQERAAADARSPVLKRRSMTPSTAPPGSEGAAAVEEEEEGPPTKVAARELPAAAAAAGGGGPAAGGGPGGPSGGGSLSLVSLATSQGPAAMDWQGGVGGDTAQAAVAAAPSSVTGPASWGRPSRPTSPAADTPRGSSRASSLVLPGASSEGNTLAISEPAMYCKLQEAVQEGGPLNLRASWLAGGPVHGDVLLSLCGVLHGQGHYLLSRWQDYPLPHFWSTTSAVFPQAAYCRSTPCALLAQLPNQYSAATWAAPMKPTQLLETHYTRRHQWRTGLPQWLVTQLDPVTPGALPQHVAQLQVAAFGSQQLLSVSSDPAWSPEEAREQTALAALHQLGAIDAAALRGPTLPGSSSGGEGASGATAEGGDGAEGAGGGREGALMEVQVVQGGTPGQPPLPSGAEVEVDVLLYIPQEWLEGDQHLLQPVLTPSATVALGATPATTTHTTAPAGPHDMLDPDDPTELDIASPSSAAAAGGRGQRLSPDSPLVEVLFPEGRYLLGVARGLRVAPGVGGVVPQLEQLVRQLQPGGQARARINVCLHGADPLQLLPRHPALLEVLHLGAAPRHKAKGHKGAAAAAGGGGAPEAPPVFSPSLARQRHQLVTQVVVERGCRTLLDAGCGEGALLRSLLSGAAYTPLQQLVGVDQSNSKLAAAGRRVDALVAASSSFMTEQQLGAAGGGMAGTAGGAGGAGGAEGAGGAGGHLSGAANGAGGGSRGAAGGAGGGAAAGGAAVQLPSAGSDGGGGGNGVGGDSSSGGGGQVASLLARVPSGTTQASFVQGPERQPSISGPLPNTMPTNTTTTASSSRQQPPAADSASPQPPQWAADVALMQADLTSPALSHPANWGSLHGVDVVACLEVVEHLHYPQQVQALISTILGGLQPNCAIITTPNWEYNAVLRSLPPASPMAWPGPPGRDGQPLRHADHKFEWDRAEFSTWANQVAAEYGYQLNLQCIGTAIQEAEALQALGGGGQMGSRGGATQVAVFSRGAGQQEQQAAQQLPAGAAQQVQPAAAVQHTAQLLAAEAAQQGPAAAEVPAGAAPTQLLAGASQLRSSSTGPPQGPAAPPALPPRPPPPAAAPGAAGSAAAGAGGAAGVVVVPAGGALVWGPKRVVVQVGSLTAPGALAASKDVAGDAMQVEHF